MNLEVDPPLANCFRKLPAVIEHEPFFKIPPNISEIIPESIEHGASSSNGLKTSQYPRIGRC
jgi:hypothetical protein